MRPRPATAFAVLALLSLPVGVVTGSKFTGFTSVVPLRFEGGTLVGAVAGDGFGRSVANAGDVNGDGVPDLIIGAAHQQGSARVVSGADGEILHTFYGGVDGRDFGAAVAGAGDVNADGYADLIVGDPLEIGPYDEANDISRLGVAHVYSGLDGSELYLLAGTGFFTFGTSVASAGDVDGDGHADVLVGEPNGAIDRNGAGRVWVFSGATGERLMVVDGADADDAFGQSVAGAGDVNGDGYPDFVVGAPAGLHDGVDTGLAIVYSGVDAAVLHTFYGRISSDGFGAAVAGAGDVNGDGYADVVIGAPWAAAGGPVQVFSGVDGTVLHTLVDDAPGARFGWAVAGAGDVDADGRDDIVVGDLTRHPGGRASVFSGRDGAVLFAVDGDASGDLFGVAVAGAGDLNADGYADVIVGASGVDTDVLDAGRVEVFAGGSNADVTPPALVCPADPIVEATGPSGAVVTFAATATDAGSPSPLIAYAVPSGHAFPLGMTVVGVTATDAAGNSASCAFTVTVRDTTAPVVATPADVAQDATSRRGAVVTFAVVAADAVDPSPSVTCAPASGTVFPIGGTTVTCTARDAASNVTVCTFRVTVRATPVSMLDDALATLRELDFTDPKVGERLASAIAQLEKAATAATGPVFFKAAGEAIHHLEKAGAKLHKQAPSGAGEVALDAAMAKIASAAQAYAMKSAPAQSSPKTERKLDRLADEAAQAEDAGDFAKAVRSYEKMWEKSQPAGGVGYSGS